MDRDLIAILACPDCSGELALEAEGAGSEILRGTLTCSRCGRRFVISNGIPRLLPSSDALTVPLDRIERHFAHEFLALQEDDRDLSPPELERYYFFSRTGLDPRVYDEIPGNEYRTDLPEGAYVPDGSFLKDKVVLDAGCGPGRFVPAAAGTGARRVVGLDLGDHIDRAARRCAALPTVSFVQGSVLAPPFKPGSFDYVYSIGVFHHTPDPPGACRQLANRVREAGSMSVWVYPPRYWGGPVRAPVTRALHFFLSRIDPARSFWFCKNVLYPIGRLQMFLARRTLTKLLFAPLFLLNIPRHPRREVMIATIFDYFCPPIISTHGYAEVEAWLRTAGFTQVRRLPVATAVRADQRGPGSIA